MSVSLPFLISFVDLNSLVSTTNMLFGRFWSQPTDVTPSDDSLKTLMESKGIKQDIILLCRTFSTLALLTYRADLDEHKEGVAQISTRLWNKIKEEKALYFDGLFIEFIQPDIENDDQLSFLRVYVSSCQEAFDHEELYWSLRNVTRTTSPQCEYASISLSHIRVLRKESLL